MPPAAFGCRFVLLLWFVLLLFSAVSIHHATWGRAGQVLRRILSHRGRRAVRPAPSRVEAAICHASRRERLLRGLLLRESRFPQFQVVQGPDAPLRNTAVSVAEGALACEGLFGPVGDRSHGPDWTVA